MVCFVFVGEGVWFVVIFVIYLVDKNVIRVDFFYDGVCCGVESDYGGFFVFGVYDVFVWVIEWGEIFYYFFYGLGYFGEVGFFFVWFL